MYKPVAVAVVRELGTSASLQVHKTRHMVIDTDTGTDTHTHTLTNADTQTHKHNTIHAPKYPFILIIPGIIELHCILKQNHRYPLAIPAYSTLSYFTLVNRKS